MIVVLISPAARAADNVALSADGASIVSISSATSVGKHLVMVADLLTNNKVPWFTSTGDTRYTFGANDPDGTIEIKLGALTEIETIGTVITTPAQDRPVTGPVTFEVSTNGVDWTDWGTPVVVKSKTPSLISETETPELVRYIKYSYGPTREYFGFGGSAVRSIFADAVPEPAAWTLMLAGFGALGAVVRGKRRMAQAAA